MLSAISTVSHNIWTKLVPQSITESHLSLGYPAAPLPSNYVLMDEFTSSRSPSTRLQTENTESIGVAIGSLENRNETSRGIEDDSSGYTAYLGRLTAVACLGGLQFGWDTGIAAGMLVAIHDDLGHSLSAREQEVIVSATTVGAICGALLGGRLSDWMGRKKVMVTAGVLFALGAVEQAASQVVRELVLGRVLVGLGVGMASMVVPTYLAECAPPSIRGRIVAMNSLLITGGQVIAYVVDALFYSLPHGWRWMVLAGGIPALFQLVGLIYLDESPRWLISQGRHSSARHVLVRIYPAADEEAISQQVFRIEQSLHGSQPGLAQTHGEHRSKETSFRAQLQAIWEDRGSRKALFLACGLQAGQQLIGANSILYYSSRLLLMVGFVANPNFAAIWVAIANFAGTAIALRFVDRLGRRKLLLYATAAASISLMCLAVALGQVNTGGVTDIPSEDRQGIGAWPFICLVAMVFFLFFYALGLGIIPWLVQSEIFPGNARALGGGLATATNWTMNLLTSATFLDLVRLISPQGCFWFYSIVGAITYTFAYIYLPELAGISINDIQTALQGSHAHPLHHGGYAPLPADSLQEGHENQHDTVFEVGDEESLAS